MGRINFASALHRASLSPRMPRGLTPGGAGGAGLSRWNGWKTG